MYFPILMTVILQFLQQLLLILLLKKFLTKKIKKEQGRFFIETKTNN